jgi:prephenate dehydrogenase
MTRIAGVDEEMWIKLYMYNKEHIVEELDGLIKNLSIYRDAIQADDEDGLREYLKNGRLIRETIKRGND